MSIFKNLLASIVVFAFSFFMGTLFFMFMRYMLNSLIELGGVTNELLLSILNFIVAGQYSDIIEVVLILSYSLFLVYRYVWEEPVYVED